ncbi:hypothetical protein [Paenibacillus macquariensis]|uniref:Uncharacterized protein n=1 Tax=Paenibacillus macquariensis TaxID=948756 RepID=A0ABY1KF55_9BACL|nr:hypothetical protein [Paenibacillus macquariensis]MEC0092488.1 hypothetical protein [Paenibacillus macquariensis]OAB35447.1 hypothetical protein PMSM_09325 [Paenibacillus macquariensis subsp. macquariensis]SIR74520.1 hypothetical protein SAMN05421578_1614 [Paenibacillus macquariensis]
MIALQLNFFDEANEDEKKQTKSLLIRYRRHKNIIAELEKIEELAPKQERAYNAYLNATLDVERAVRLIIDQDIKRAIQMRFIDGIRRKDVVVHYRFLDPSTVDRRINRGIESIANTIKVFES